ncbi:MAG: hypothetical protein HYR85_07330 [Planctomycetes bacterium]|nr:hypothetical protein [Planctomycetota bacterium]MBI3847569.1 hypothetical protein [Planctomycetota bacterium]
MKRFFTLLVLSVDVVGLVLAGLYVAQPRVAVDAVVAGWRHPAAVLFGAAITVGCLIYASRRLESRKRGECFS